VIPDDEIALPVGGTRRVGRRRWLALAASCKLQPRVAERVMKELADAVGEAVDLVNASLLPADMKQSYQALLRERGARL
jgi:hypothetical protein